MKSLCTIFFCLATVFTTTLTALDTIPLSDTYWQAYSQVNEAADLSTTTYQGTKYLRLNGGTNRGALLIDSTYRNFRLHVDVSGNYMPGIGFRRENPWNYELLYFRTFVGGSFEAVQYTPITNGALPWTLYNNNFEQSANINTSDNFHVELVVSGNNLKVYMDYSSTPTMDIILQHNQVEQGGIWLESFGGSARFSNVCIERLPLDGEEKLSAPDVMGAITQWELSPQLSSSEWISNSDLISLTENIESWSPIHDTLTDVINLSKYYEIPDGIAIARTMLNFDRATRVLLKYNFVERFALLYNGQVLVDTTEGNFDRMDGYLDSLYIDFAAGVNTLYVVSEGDRVLFDYNSMGQIVHQNWGFSMKVQTPPETPSDANSNPEANNTFRLYPNPSNHYVYVELPASQACMYTICSTDGRILQQGTFKGSSNRIATHNMASGTYILTLNSNGFKNSSLLSIQ